MNLHRTCVLYEIDGLYVTDPDRLPADPAIEVTILDLCRDRNQYEVALIGPKWAIYRYALEHWGDEDLERWISTVVRGMRSLRQDVARAGFNPGTIAVETEPPNGSSFPGISDDEEVP